MIEDELRDCDAQLSAVAQFFDGLAAQQDRMPAASLQATNDYDDEEARAAC